MNKQQEFLRNKKAITTVDNHVNPDTGYVSTKYYDCNGMPIKKISVSNSGDVLRNYYDDRGNLVLVITDDTIDTAQYDKNNNCIESTAYCNIGQDSQFDMDMSRTIYEYNSNNKLTRQINEFSNGARNELTYIYDDHGNFIKSVFNNDAGIRGEDICEILYTVDGRVEVMRNGEYSNYYNNDGLLVRVQAEKSNAVYDYDSDGKQIHSRTDFSNKNFMESWFEYNEFGKLVYAKAINNFNDSRSVSIMEEHYTYNEYGVELSYWKIADGQLISTIKHEYVDKYTNKEDDCNE